MPDPTKTTQITTADLCKFCGMIPGSLDDKSTWSTVGIWICPLCGNTGPIPMPVRPRMTDLLETK